MSQKIANRTTGLVDYKEFDLTQKKWRESLECFFTKRINCSGMQYLIVLDS
ncbi:hypothetical protein HET73_03380 [Wolbachia endosymbiont of Atemnus politus]|uniref:hypothetical protein n=1 Tax=Wolbachia endosymbiont of Atemnus politus TaxID=2682840 RepID=UPI001574A085|nr:hypothetical protein [Wolbachia endosymbiont of Atemnus politus]NSM56567.1 hypothetical protein [Wolbachia endosymbiont of Atemnus politus]